MCSFGGHPPGTATRQRVVLSMRHCCRHGLSEECVVSRRHGWDFDLGQQRGACCSREGKAPILGLASLAPILGCGSSGRSSLRALLKLETQLT